MHAEKIKHHIDHLKAKHENLDKQIKESYNHYDSDSLIKKLKLEKLHIKTEITTLENKIATGAV